MAAVQLYHGQRQHGTDVSDSIDQERSTRRSGASRGHKELDGRVIRPGRTDPVQKNGQDRPKHGNANRWVERENRLLLPVCLPLGGPPTEPFKFGSSEESVGSKQFQSNERTSAPARQRGSAPRASALTSTLNGGAKG